jgi:hypothetical protein
MDRRRRAASRFFENGSPFFLRGDYPPFGFSPCHPPRFLLFLFYHEIGRQKERKRIFPDTRPPFPLSERIGNAEQKVEKRTG